MTTDDSSALHGKCPSDEFLVAALTAGINDADQHWLDEHLDTCDRCLDAVGAAMRRLRLADEIPAAVPAAVRQRAAAAAALEPAAAILPGPQPLNHPAPVGRLSARLSSVVQRVGRPALLIPALAAAAGLVVATQTWMTSGMPRPLTRSIALPQHARVTAVKAAVRRSPNGHAEVVATVARGTLVDISGEERDWAHVTLPNGTEGWVDQGALR